MTVDASILTTTTSSFITTAPAVTEERFKFSTFRNVAGTSSISLCLPHRHGHGLSPGEYIVDINNRLTTAAKSEELAWPEMVKLHEVYNRDVAAAVVVR